MTSWFSLNTSIKFLLSGFTLNQEGFLSYLRRFYEEDAGPFEEPGAVIDGAVAGAQHTGIATPQEGMQSHRFSSETAYAVASP